MEKQKKKFLTSGFFLPAINATVFNRDSIPQDLYTMTFGLIVLEFGRKNKKEIIIKLVQQSKALKSIGSFLKRQFYR